MQFRTPTHGTPEVEAKRKEYNSFIRSAGIFDGVIDFDVITLDPKTGELKAEYQPNSTTGGPGDKLHPNRAGYRRGGRDRPRHCSLENKEVDPARGGRRL